MNLNEAQYNAITAYLNTAVIIVKHDTVAGHPEISRPVRRSEMIERHEDWSGLQPTGRINRLRLTFLNDPTDYAVLYLTHEAYHDDFRSRP